MDTRRITGNYGDSCCCLDVEEPINHHKRNRNPQQGRCRDKNGCEGSKKRPFTTLKTEAKMNHRLPPIIIHEVLDHVPLAEQAGEQLIKRGDWQKLKEICGDGSGIKVGIGDTGVDTIHLRGDLSGVKDAKDFTNSRYGAADKHSHGSHVTGHIGARSDGSGMVGIASSCDLYHAKVLGDSGSGSTRGIANGIRWLVDQGCHIVSLSLGGSFSQDIEGACREATEQGVFVLAAMGNDGLRGDGHPGNSGYTFGITAIDFDKKLASFSSRSPHATYCGYGVQVLSCGLNGKYVRMSGTSMATPDQAGVMALVLSYLLKTNKPIPKTMEEMHKLYIPHIEDLGEPGRDVGYGWGFFNIWNFLTDTSPAPTPEKWVGGMWSDSGAYLLGSDQQGDAASIKIKDKIFSGYGMKL